MNMIEMGIIVIERAKGRGVVEPKNGRKKKPVKAFVLISVGNVDHFPVFHAITSEAFGRTEVDLVHAVGK